MIVHINEIMRISVKGHKYYFSTDISVNEIEKDEFVQILGDILFDIIGVAPDKAQLEIKDGKYFFDFVTDTLLKKQNYKAEICWIAVDKKNNNRQAYFNERPDFVIGMRAIP